MSFDIFLQGFENGDAAPGMPDEANRVLLPYLRVTAEGHANVIAEDGSAEVYGIGTDSLMFTHAAGRRVWDLLYDVARSANWAILPVDGPACVPAADMVAHLPGELSVNAVVVNSGEDVLGAMGR